MDTKRWKVMLAVDDYGSFTRAGEVLGYTQSGITQMMKSLEREVGFPLFVKDSHGMRLTREAQALLPHVRSLLAADEVVRQEIASLKGAQVGTICHRHLLKLFHSLDPQDPPGAFHRDHPDIHFKVIEGDEGELADWIQERRVDIGFISRQEEQRYQFLPVMEDELFAVLPAEHPFAVRDEIPLELFEDIPFVTTAVCTRQRHSPGSEAIQSETGYPVRLHQ